MNSAGYRNGATTASRRIFLAPARPATSPHRTSGDPTYTSRAMTRASALRSSDPKSRSENASDGARSERARKAAEAAGGVEEVFFAASAAPTPTTPKAASGACFGAEPRFSLARAVTSAPVAPPPLGAFVRVRPLVFVSPSRAARVERVALGFGAPRRSVFVFSGSSSRALPSLPESFASRAYSFGGAPCVATWCSSCSRNILSRLTSSATVVPASALAASLASASADSP